MTIKKGAIGIVFSKDRSQILIIKRRDVPIWVLPGGGIEDNEQAATAVERELFEETGLQVAVSRLVGTYEPINFLTAETFVFECSPTVLLPDKFEPQAETQKVAFHPLNKLPEPFFFLHAEWVQDALLNAKEPLVKKMTSITFFALIKNILCHPILLLRYLLSRLGFPINQ